MSAEPLPPPPLDPLLIRDRLLAAGWTDREIRWRVRTGGWVQLRFGVYVEAAVLASLADQPARLHALYVRAALHRLAGRRLAASHESAALLLGIDLLDPSRGVTITRDVAEGRHVQRYRSLAVHSAALPRGHVHVAELFDVPVTSASRTVVDLARTRSRRHAVVAADSALHSGRVTEEQLLRMLDDVDGWPGALAARDVVRFADGRAESVLESLSRVGIDECGLPAPEPQVTIGDDAGTTARVDFLWREHHTIGEADGLTKYVDRADKMAERRRQDWVESLGLEVVRWTIEDLSGRRLLALRRRVEEKFARAHQRWGD
ncbi:MAG TPA: hypothetical protein VNB94_11385 [Mycobacteriales bacterium]|nr:hypothetical protein [Mycobacteriales bacterium]